MNTAKKFGSPFFHSPLPVTLALAVLAFFGWRAVFQPRPVAAAATAAPDALADGATLQEGFSFEIRDLAVRHQGGNTLHLLVRYTYRPGIKTEDYPDFRRLAEVCEDFFVNDQDERAFWEIVNKDLTAQMLEKFPVLAAVTLEIRVAPTTRIPWPRASCVTRTRPPAR